MTRYETRGGLDSLLLAVVAAMAVVCSQLQQQAAAADESGEQGRIVNISPDGKSVETPTGDETADQADEAPAYWIGIQGGPINDPVLRTHLQLADDVGVAVMDVLPGSPAEKAGVKKHDVLIGVNGETITEMPVLQQAVAKSEARPVHVKLIRLGQEMTVEITPEKRPENLPMAQGQPPFGNGAGGQFNFGFPMGDLDNVLKQFQHGGVRVLGPGMIMNNQSSMASLPNGVAITVTRTGDGPATAIVKKGDQTWTVNGDDKDAIAKLPDDVRPHVEQMLGQAGGGFKVHFGNGENLGAMLPQRLQNFDFQIDGQRAAEIRKHAEAAREHAEAATQKVLQRMEQMEKRLEELHKQLEPALPGDAPAHQEHHEAAADPSST